MLGVSTKFLWLVDGDRHRSFQPPKQHGGEPGNRHR